ncbi:glutamate ABC transporter substrate-binding protein [Enteractinococcus fodinae]|uniref:Glutamate transport system substrate-binding protein n=1 Tax=Enteractinococcus fodinae TaxID=684663 RepID=A0ABU2B1M8_9MICC|nr:glutamate ABC transporter substrate-binding protein [Enteractinococcus fodinae]MDR7347500.1 glutamate transport system substrate-binding protein [Enteractinococcus fodinae]
MKTPWKKIAALGAAAALALSACSPGASEDAETDTEAEGNGGGGETITVGIKYDQPGLGFREGNNEPTGFDVDVAKAVLAEMGYEEDQIEWAEAPTPQRENMLENGQVDMIFATYSITEERAERVDFAGPYFMAGQDILVRVDDEEINGPEDLNGKNLCSVTGSTPAQNVRDTYADEVELVEQDGYSECLTFLQSGQVDAVTTDDIILAGLAASDEYAGEFKVVGEAFTEEPYGVGLPNGSTETCEQVNEAIQTLRDDGTIDELLAANTEGVDYEANAELNDNLELRECE